LANDTKQQQELNRLLDRYNKALEETVKKQESVSKGMSQEVSLLEKKMKLLSLQNKELAGALKFAEKEEKIRNQEIAARQKKLKDQIKLGKLSKEEVEQAEAELALKKGINKEGANAIKQLTKREKLQKSLKKSLKEQAELAKDFRSQMASNLEISTKFSETMTGGLAAQAGGAANWAKEFASSSNKVGDAGRSMGKAIGGVFGFVISQLEESMFGIDSLRANITFATQATKDFTDTAAETYATMKGLGLETSKVDSAMIALYENTALFRRSLPASQTAMGVFTAKMQQAGIDGKITSETFQLLNKTMGLQGQELIDTTDKLKNFGQAIKVSVGKLLLDMSAAAPVLAAHGKNMVNVFKGLAAQAEVTGMQMGDLLGIAGQFDTFDQSADAVGKLNSILGGPYLNSIEMVYMSEEERIQAMRDSLELSGKSWDSMGRFEKKAVAAAAGINDAAKANEFFGTTSEAMADAAAKAEGDMTEGEKMTDLSERATSFMARMTQMVKGIVPVFENMDDFLEKIETTFGNFQKNTLPKLKEGMTQMLEMIKKIGPLLDKLDAMSEKWFGKEKADLAKDTEENLKKRATRAAGKRGKGASAADTGWSWSSLFTGGGPISPKGYASGGYVKETAPALVHKGEYVVPANQVAAAGIDPSVRPPSLSVGNENAQATAAAVKEGISQVLASLGMGTGASTVVQLHLDGKRIHDVVVDHMKQRTVESPA